MQELSIKKVSIRGEFTDMEAQLADAATLTHELEEQVATLKAEKQQWESQMKQKDDAQAELQMAYEARAACVALPIA